MYRRQGEVDEDKSKSCIGQRRRGDHPIIHGDRDAEVSLEGIDVYFAS